MTSRYLLSAALAALLVGACHAPAPQGDTIALVRDAMVESARTKNGPPDAAPAAAAVAAARGDAGSEEAGGGGLFALAGGG